LVGGSGVSDSTDLAIKVVSWRIRPAFFTASSNWIKGKGLRRHDGICRDLSCTKDMKRRTGEECTCIVYHTCMKKMRDHDKREKRPIEAWAWGTAPIAGRVDDKVSCRASSAAEVVLGRVQKCRLLVKLVSLADRGKIACAIPADIPGWEAFTRIRR
jgi:hypothetical protein